MTITLEDSSCRRLVALTSWQSSDRYGGTRLFKTLNIKNASLIELGALPNRQPLKLPQDWRDVVTVMRCAAAFCTACRFTALGGATSLCYMHLHVCSCVLC